jgi:hypothetical protein
VSLTPEVLWGLAGAIFGAGGVVSLLRLLKKDVDGLGIRVRRETEIAFEERYRLAILIMVLVPAEDREWFADRLLRR